MSADAVVEAGNKVGRSFSLGTFIPTIGLAAWVLFVYLLSPSFGQPLTWPSTPVPDLSWAQVGLTGFAFVVLSLSLHPLIFSTTQLLEGYWGSSWLSVFAATTASRRHRARLHDLERIVDDRSRRLDLRAAGAHRAAGSPPEELNTWSLGWIDDATNQDLQRLIVARDAAAKMRDSYPESASRVMPTLLGNALRRDEDRIGAQYGLDALGVAGHLAFLLPAPQGDHLDDARQQLDTAVRLSASGLVAFAGTGVWLLVSGWSLLLALAPLGFAFISYRGAIGSGSGVHAYVGCPT